MPTKVAHIEAETERIGELIRRAEREIALMREFHTALLAEAVTGKNGSSIEIQNFIIQFTISDWIINFYILI